MKLPKNTKQVKSQKTPSKRPTPQELAKIAGAAFYEARMKNPMIQNKKK